MRKFICIILCILLLVGCKRTRISDTLEDKADEFKGYGKNYTMEDAKEDGFYIEASIPETMNENMIKFIEYIWQEREVEIYTAKVKDEALILSYLIYHDDIIYTLDYNTQDTTYEMNEYKYLTYDFDTETGVQSRYLTNDSNLEGKDQLTEEQKMNSYYLCSYLIPENE